MAKKAAAKGKSPKKAAKSPKKTGVRKTKKAKDPNAPKRALSAYMFFAKDTRKDILKQHPSWGVTDIGKELGARWGKMSSAQKAPFDKQAAADKARYERDMASYRKKK